MRKITTILIFSFTTLLSVAVVAQRDSEVTDTETKSFEFKEDGMVIVESDDGNIEISSWDKNEVEVVMKKRAWGRSRSDAEDYLKQIDIDISLRGNKLYIRDITELDRERRGGLMDLFRNGWNLGTSVEFIIKVPKKVNLDLTADDGDVVIEDVEGKISVNVDDGNLDVRNVRSDRFEAQIDDGDMELESISQITKAGRLMLFGDDNSMYLRRVQYEIIEIESDDGEITFRDVTLKELDVDIDDGEFEADMVVLDEGRVRILLDDGDATLRLSENFSGLLNLSAYDGKIRSNFPLEIEKEDGHSWVKERIGKGATSIRVEVSNGYITINH